MLDQSTIDKITDAAQIQDVVGDYVTLRKRGVNLLGCVRFTTRKRLRLQFRPPKGYSNALVCGKGGNSVHFIMEHEQISLRSAQVPLPVNTTSNFRNANYRPRKWPFCNDRESMFWSMNLHRNTSRPHFTTISMVKSIDLGYFGAWFPRRYYSEISTRL